VKELKGIVCSCRRDHRFMCRVYIRVTFAHSSSLRSSPRTQNKRLHPHRIKAILDRKNIRRGQPLCWFRIFSVGYYPPELYF
jgi:hypothetical protein